MDCTANSFCAGLSAGDRAIYKAQLTLPDGTQFPDPFATRDGWKNDPYHWPHIHYYDILNYFVFKTSLFSFEQTKAYKSLEAYNYAVEGHVQAIRSLTLNKHKAFVAQVLPSQRQGQKSCMYKAFLIVDQDGQIHTAHCTCMAGNGKACSHAAAIAFKVEFAVRAGLVDRAPTEELCTWNSTAKKKVAPARLVEMDFSKPLMNQGKSNPVAKTRQPRKRHCKTISLKEVAEQFPEAAATKTFKAYPLTPESDIQTQETDTIYIVSKIVHEVKGLANCRQQFFSRMSLSRQSIIDIARATRGQQGNPNWFKIRKGRITASNFGCVLKAKSVTPSLIQRVLGEINTQVFATAWGITHEKDGINCFSAKTGFQVIETGVWLDSSGTLGASPDGLVGEDAEIEVKCPFSHREHTIEECLKDSKFCLDNSSYGLCLKESHPYWDQVQGQLHLTERNVCYFVVWTKRDVAIIKIAKDILWVENVTILKQFYLNHIFPKLMS